MHYLRGIFYRGQRLRSSRWGGSRRGESSATCPACVRALACILCLASTAHATHRLRAETVMIDQPWDLGASSPSDLQKSGGLGPLAHGFGSGRTSRWPMIRGGRRCNTHGDQQRKISLPPLARRPACCSIPIVLDRRKQTVRPAFARASLWSGVESVTSTTWRN